MLMLNLKDRLYACQSPRAPYPSACRQRAETSPGERGERVRGAAVQDLRCRGAISREEGEVGGRHIEGIGQGGGTE